MKKVLKIILLVITLLVLITALYIVYELFSVETDTLQIQHGTNVNAAIASAEEYLDDFRDDYPELAEYLSSNKPNTYAIPGLIQAKNIYAAGRRKGKIGYANDMTPQGIAVTDRYVIISAYSKSKKFHSVLWMLDKHTKTFIKTIVLAGTEHVGGLAYDGAHQRLWITSASETSKAMAASISLNCLLAYDFDQSGRCIDYEKQYILDGLERTSYMMMEGRSLYAGCFAENQKGVLCSYSLDDNGYPLSENGHVKPLEKVSTPAQIQGIVFYDDAVILSQSYGSADSHMLVYERQPDGEMENLTKGKLLFDAAAPPYLEQMCTDGNDVYALFEAAASAYRFHLDILTTDHILKFDFSMVD